MRPPESFQPGHDPKCEVLYRTDTRAMLVTCGLLQRQWSCEPGSKLVDAAAARFLLNDADQFVGKISKKPQTPLAPLRHLRETAPAAPAAAAVDDTDAAYRQYPGSADAVARAVVLATDTRLVIHFQSGRQDAVFPGFPVARILPLDHGVLLQAGDGAAVPLHLLTHPLVPPTPLWHQTAPNKVPVPFECLNATLLDVRMDSEGCPAFVVLQKGTGNVVAYACTRAGPDLWPQVGGHDLVLRGDAAAVVDAAGRGRASRAFIVDGLCGARQYLCVLWRQRQELAMAAVGNDASQTVATHVVQDALAVTGAVRSDWVSLVTLRPDGRLWLQFEDGWAEQASNVALDGTRLQMTCGTVVVASKPQGDSVPTRVDVCMAWPARSLAFQAVETLRTAVGSGHGRTRLERGLIAGRATSKNDAAAVWDAFCAAVLILALPAVAHPAAAATWARATGNCAKMAAFHHSATALETRSLGGALSEEICSVFEALHGEFAALAAERPFVARVRGPQLAALLYTLAHGVPLGGPFVTFFASRTPHGLLEVADGENVEPEWPVPASGASTPPRTDLLPPSLSAAPVRALFQNLRNCMTAASDGLKTLALEADAAGMHADRVAALPVALQLPFLDAIHRLALAENHSATPRKALLRCNRRDWLSLAHSLELPKPWEQMLLAVRDDSACDLQTVLQVVDDEMAAAAASSVRGDGRRRTSPHPHASGAAAQGSAEPSALEDLVHTERSEMRYPLDLRLCEASRMLDGSRAHTLHVSAEARETLGEDATAAAQETALLQLAERVWATPLGRAGLTFGLCSVSDSEPGAVAEPALAAGASNYALRAGAGPPLAAAWARFHNGAAAALQVAPRAEPLPDSWLALQRPDHTDDAHGGFLLGLGLNGHLRHLNRFHMFRYLTQRQARLQTGCLLGLAASHRGTGHAHLAQTAKCDVGAFLDDDFRSHVSTEHAHQLTAMAALGLLFLQTGDREVSLGLLQQLLRRELVAQDAATVDAREEHCLVAGVALGLVQLGSAPSGDGATLEIVRQLWQLRNGSGDSPAVESLGLLLRVEDGTGDADAPATGAAVALALIYAQSGDSGVSAALKPRPETRTDLVALHVLCASIVALESVEPTAEFVRASVPSSVRALHRGEVTCDGCSRVWQLLGNNGNTICLVPAGTAVNAKTPPETLQPVRAGNVLFYASSADSWCCECALAAERANVSKPAADLCYYQCVAGACLAIGIRFAGTGDGRARTLLLNWFDKLAAIAGSSVFGRNARDLVALALGLTLAGFSDVDVLRRLRTLHYRLDDTTPFSTHAAVCMATGWLCLGHGAWSFRSTVDGPREETLPAIAGLLLAVMPRFATDAGLAGARFPPALRHFWALAAEPRCLVARNVATGRVEPVPIRIKRHGGAVETLQTPCILPPLGDVLELAVDSRRYLPITLKAPLRLAPPFELRVQRRLGFCSAREDPSGLGVADRVLVPPLPSGCLLPLAVETTLRGVYRLADAVGTDDAASSTLAAVLRHVVAPVVESGGAELANSIASVLVSVLAAERPDLLPLALSLALLEASPEHPLALAVVPQLPRLYVYLRHVLPRLTQSVPASERPRYPDCITTESLRGIAERLGTILDDDSDTYFSDIV